MDKGNSNKLHSGNTPLSQTHSDQAPPHSKQDANSSQESSVKQAAKQSNEQSIHGEKALPFVNAPSKSQAQRHRNNVGIQAQNASNVQRSQQQAKNTGFDKEYLEQRSFNSKETENYQQQESFVKQTALQYFGKNAKEGETRPSINTVNEIQSQPNNAGSQMQNPPSSGQEMQQHLKEDKLDKPKIENPQQESIRDFVENKFKKTDKKIEEGKKSISGPEKILQDEYEVDQDKTLLGTATKNLATSAGEGLLSTAKDINEAIKNLPPEPPIIFP